MNDNDRLLDIAAKLVSIAAGLITIATAIKRGQETGKPRKNAVSLASTSGNPEPVVGEGDLPATYQYIINVVHLKV